MSGRDFLYRPILVIDVKKMVKMNVPTDDILSTLFFFFSHIINNVLIEGQIENWVVIIDLGQVGLFSASGPFKKSISFLSDNFRCRMASASVVNCSGSVSMLWGVAKGFVEEETQKKISFESAGIPTKIISSVNASQLEKKYGGTLPNITAFWYVSIKEGLPKYYPRSSRPVSPFLWLLLMSIGIGIKKASFKTGN